MLLLRVVFSKLLKCIASGSTIKAYLSVQSLQNIPDDVREAPHSWAFPHHPQHYGMAVTLMQKMKNSAGALFCLLGHSEVKGQE